jgi:hypothetical protein
MTAEFFLVLGLFAVVSVNGAIVCHRAMARQTVLDIARADQADAALERPRIGASVPFTLAMAIGMLSIIAFVATGVGDVLQRVLTSIDLHAPIEIVPLGIVVDSTAFAPAAGGLSWFAATCLGLLGLMAAFLRHTAGYVFFAFHAALACLCLVVDYLVDAPVTDRASVTTWVLNTAFYLILASQFFFAFFLRRTLRQVLLGAASAAMSGASLALGATVLAVLANSVDETSYMLMIYLTVAYGIVALHVTALTLSLSSG